MAASRIKGITVEIGDDTTKRKRIYTSASIKKKNP